MRGTCHYCGAPDTEADLRPYGPGGADVCFLCATATPEREAAAKAAFGAILDATSVLGPVAIGTAAGPQPFDPREIRR
jgi:hypothetical protein